MAKPNPLVLGTKKEEDAADALTIALTTIGTARPEIVEKTRPESKRRSRFFYEPTKSFREDLEDRMTISKPKVVEIVDEQIESRRKTYKQELPPKLNKNLEVVREFWLKEVAPLTLAAQSGSDQARDVVQRLLEVDIDGTPFVVFSKMLQQGTNIKLAQFVAKYLKLPPESAAQLIESIQPKQVQREVMFYPDFLDRRQRSSTGSKLGRENPAPTSHSHNLTSSQTEE